jgi:hypothetical protein
MKIACLVTFKNESDVLPEWIKSMENQVDYFLFRDNQSTDSGSKIVQSHPKTVFYEVVNGTFEIRMYDKLIVEARKFLTNDDWMILSAADLFPFFNIREKIEKVEQLNQGYNCIKAFYPNFFFTKEMFEKYAKSKQYKQTIKNFNVNNYSHFKNTGGNPPIIIKNVGDDKNRVRFTKPKQEPPAIPNKKEYDESLCFGHYRFRSPKQMISRFEIRKEVNPTRKDHLSFVHYPTWNWKDYLISEKHLEKLNGEIKITQLNRIKLEGLVKLKS